MDTDLHPLRFLSTPSARRATNYESTLRDGIFISIHALREEGDIFEVILMEACHGISIHALREEGDGRLCGLEHDPLAFLSTPSARRATRQSAFAQKVWHISIHALREEGDAEFAAATEAAIPFLSTPSARRATAKTEKNISAFVSL